MRWPRPEDSQPTIQFLPRCWWPIVGGPLLVVHSQKVQGCDPGSCCLLGKSWGHRSKAVLQGKTPDRADLGPVEIMWRKARAAQLRRCRQGCTCCSQEMPACRANCAVTQHGHAHRAAGSADLARRFSTLLHRPTVCRRSNDISAEATIALCLY